MSKKLRFQFATLLIVILLVGFASGLYAASLVIGNFIPELAR